MFTLYCAARGCLVIAYEPAEKAMEELRHSAAVADEIGLGKIFVNRKAISDKNGLALLVHHGETGCNSLVRVGAGPNEVVKTVTLAEAMGFVHWDCVKMDIEGSEYGVLKSASPDVLERIKFLTLEVHNDILSGPQCEEIDHILRESFPKVTVLPVKVDGVPTEQIAAYFCER
jgi:FkbM family methyltransferase